MFTPITNIEKRFNKYWDKIFFQYGQTVDWVSYWRCWMYRFLISCMALMNIDIGEKWLRDFIDYMLSKGINNEWNQPELWAIYVKEWWNARYPNNKVDFVNTDFNSPIFRTYERMGCPFSLSFVVSPKWREDARDYVLDYKSYFSYSSKDAPTKYPNGKPIPIKYRRYGGAMNWHVFCVQNIAWQWRTAIESTNLKYQYSIPWKVKRLSEVEWFHLQGWLKTVVCFPLGK